MINDKLMQTKTSPAAKNSDIKYWKYQLKTMTGLDVRQEAYNLQITI